MADLGLSLVHLKHCLSTPGCLLTYLYYVNSEALTSTFMQPLPELLLLRD